MPMGVWRARGPSAALTQHDSCVLSLDFTFLFPVFRTSTQLYCSRSALITTQSTQPRSLSSAWALCCLQQSPSGVLSFHPSALATKPPWTLLPIMPWAHFKWWCKKTNKKKPGAPNFLLHGLEQNHRARHPSHSMRIRGRDGLFCPEMIC